MNFTDPTLFDRITIHPQLLDVEKNDVVTLQKDQNPPTKNEGFKMVICELLNDVKTLSLTCPG